MLLPFVAVCLASPEAWESQYVLQWNNRRLLSSRTTRCLSRGVETDSMGVSVFAAELAPAVDGLRHHLATLFREIKLEDS